MKHLLLLITLATTLCAQTEPAEHKLATIEGSVFNAITGEPVPKVGLKLVANTPVRTTGSESQFPNTYSASTDNQGKFTIEKIGLGPYMLTAARPGFIKRFYATTQNSNIGSLLLLTPGQHTKELNIKLMPQAVISGRILNTDGEPLLRARVQVLQAMRVRGKRQLTLMGTTDSNDIGEFRIPNLSPGRYLVNVIPPNQAQPPAEVNMLTSRTEEDIATFYPSAVDESSARPIDLAGGENLTAIDIQVKRSPVFRLRGKIAGLTASTPNIHVMAYPSDGTPSVVVHFGAHNRVRPDNSFDIAGLPPGSYALIAHTGERMRIIGRTQVNITREDVSGVTLPVFENLSVKGTLRVEGDLQNFEKTWGRKLHLQFFRIAASAIDGVNSTYPRIPVKADGTFNFENAGAEKLRLTVFGLPQGLWLKSVTSNGRDITDTGLDLSSGATSPVEITIGVGTGSISGAIANDKQQPAPGAMVMVIPDPYQPNRYEVFRFVTANEKGIFKIGNLPPGPHRIYAWKQFDPATHSDPEFLKTFESRARRVTIKADTEENETLTLIEQP